MDYTFAELAEKLGIDPNNPTYEGQQKLKDWLAINQKSETNPNGYEPGDLTNKYLNTPTEQPQEEMPQDSVLARWSPSSAPWNRQEGGGSDSMDQVNQAIEADKQRQEEEKQARRQKAAEGLKAFNNDLRNYSAGISNALSAWTPVGVAALGGRDRSGEAAGYAAQAAQNQYNAAQNEKLRQQNMQQAMDNTIADKMAAAESDIGAKQVARELGPEAGAQGAAAEAASKIATPDLWKQKQLQNERRDVAAQNLAEVNRNKLMAIGNETNESMTNYATNVEDSQNAYKAALANANGKSETKTENKSKEDTEEKKEETPTTPSGNTSTTEETKTETTEAQPAGTTSVAPSNQESEGTETVTDQMKAQQIHDRIEALYKESEEAAKSHDANKVKALADEYDQLVADFAALPKEVQQIGYRQFDPRHSELNAENADYDYSAIASAVNDRTM